MTTNYNFKVVLTDTDGNPIACVTDPLAVRITNDSLFFTKIATDRVDSDNPFSIRLSDGEDFYNAVKSEQLPASLTDGRLDVNIGSIDLGLGTFSVLSATATAVAPSYIEGSQVSLSTNLVGDLRVSPTSQGPIDDGGDSMGFPIQVGGKNSFGKVRSISVNNNGELSIISNSLRRLLEEILIELRLQRGVV